MTNLFIGVVGSRCFQNKDLVKEKMSKIYEKYCLTHDIVFVSGGANGVDSFAREICEEQGIPFVEIPVVFYNIPFVANKSLFAKSYYARNSAVAELSNILLCFYVGTEPNGGTANTDKKASASGKTVYRYYE